MFMFKLNNTDTRTTIRFEIFIANFEHISNFFLVLQLLILNIYLLTGLNVKSKTKWCDIPPKCNTPQLKLGLTRI